MIELIASRQSARDGEDPARHVLDESAILTLYGPFHRVESPSQTVEDARLQARSGEVWGTPARPSGLFPCVKAYPGELAILRRGIEFTTPVQPDLQSSTPIEFRWYYPQTPGVELRSEDGTDYACIRADVENRQP